MDHAKYHSYSDLSCEKYTLHVFTKEIVNNVKKIKRYFEYGKNFAGPRVLDSDNVGAGLPLQGEGSTFLHPKLVLYGPPRNDENQTSNRTSKLTASINKGSSSLWHG